MRAIVVGAGIVGAACARSLARAGVDVLVLERGAAVGGTSAACEGNLLVSDKTPGPELDLSLLAADRWATVAAELHEELGAAFPSVEYERKGGLVVSTTADGADALRAFAATQRAAGVDAQDVDTAGALALEPYLTRDVTAGVLYPQDAQVQPVTAAEALLASARHAGATVLTETEVVGAVRSPDGRLIGVSTPAGDHGGDVVVNAAGPWAGDVARRLGVHLPVLPRRGMVLVTTRMPHRVLHKVYDADYVGATQSADADLQTSTVVESTAAGTVLIGSSRQRVGFDDRLDVEVVREIAAKSLRIFPFLTSASVLRTYGGFRPYMPDHLPLVGADPRLPGLLHVTGHEGAGIGLSVPSADLLHALVTGSAAPLDPAAFAVDRPTLAPYLEEAS
ncbi:FAD-binding oxidoreductase [Mumia sp. zg.B21]|uniref:NAD(P)/FAD-dependent oxidoreductase n=1 Tax=Mumia sp. zg.B21 TaxID=2855447 RepID=UPI001C6DECFF|nr:FAD-dependent oxidoreductase [Mumia sp. zg.B21]MBW9210634.1 FAD-binding oxidoreductase [Mumia sp. zg.B21]